MGNTHEVQNYSNNVFTEKSGLEIILTVAGHADRPFTVHSHIHFIEHS